MNFPELMYNSLVFFFQDIWHFIGLIIIILAVRGEISKSVSGIKGFFKRVNGRYKGRISREDLLARKDIPADVKKLLSGEKLGKGEDKRPKGEFE